MREKAADLPIPQVESGNGSAPLRVAYIYRTKADVVRTPGTVAREQNAGESLAFESANPENGLREHAHHLQDAVPRLRRAVPETSQAPRQRGSCRRSREKYDTLTGLASRIPGNPSKNASVKQRKLPAPELSKEISRTTSCAAW